MAPIAATILIFFGLLGKQDLVSFQISGVREVVQLPSLDVHSGFLGIISGVILLSITGYSALLVRRNIKVPIGMSLLFGGVALVALLGWLAAGESVPVSFILGSALVLAVPIILGAMAGVMSERVGVVNIAIEGQLLTGAFMAAVVSTLTGNQLLGLVSAMITAAAFSAILAVFSVRYLAQQIIVFKEMRPMLGEFQEKLLVISGHIVDDLRDGVALVKFLDKSLIIVLDLFAAEHFEPG
jgi:simple sugar transport system permease protein